MARKVYTPEERLIVRSSVSQRARFLYQQHGRTQTYAANARGNLADTRSGIRAFRNLGQLTAVLDLAANSINKHYRDSSGHLSASNQDLVATARQFSGAVTQGSRRLEGLDAGYPCTPFGDVLADAEREVDLTQKAAKAALWDAHEHYQGHRAHYVAIGIVEMSRAGIEYNGPSLPEGVDPSNIMSVAQYAVHASGVEILPPPPAPTA